MEELAKLYYQFWSQFTGNAYAEGEIPETFKYPYITYQLITPGTLETTLQNVIVWDKPTNNSISGINKIVAQIMTQIPPQSYKQLSFPNGEGAVYLFRGNPFSQKYTQEDKKIKAMYLNVELRNRAYI